MKFEYKVLYVLPMWQIKLISNRTDFELTVYVCCPKKMRTQSSVFPI